MRLATRVLVAVVLMWPVLGLCAEVPEKGPRPGGGPFDPMRIPIMTALDKNGDGELSPEEIAGASEAMKKLDKNQDGRLTREELRPPMIGRRGPGGPGGPGEMGPGRGGPGAGGPAGRSGGLESSSLPTDDTERKILAALQQINEKQGRMMNVPPQDGRLLRLLVESLGAKKAVEFGTSNGISAIWICNGLRKTGGKLTTHEIEPDVAALARQNFLTAGVAELVTIIEGDAHKKIVDLKGPIDLVFIDADKEGYLDYLKQTLPLVRPGGLILAHNMNPRMADARFVKAITTDPALETVFYTEGGGMSVTLKKR